MKLIIPFHHWGSWYLSKLRYFSKVVQIITKSSGFKYKWSKIYALVIPYHPQHMSLLCEFSFILLEFPVMSLGCGLHRVNFRKPGFGSSFKEIISFSFCLLLFSKSPLKCHEICAATITVSMLPSKGWEWYCLMMVPCELRLPVTVIIYLFIHSFSKYLLSMCLKEIHILWK